MCFKDSIHRINTLGILMDTKTNIIPLFLRHSLEKWGLFVDKYHFDIILNL